MNIAICEDTRQDEEILLSLLKESQIPSECTVFRSGEELLEHYAPQTYDLILTDICMGGMSGIEAITRIREIDRDVPVAFVTTSIEYTLESYRLSALRYIEKPYREQDIADILNLALMMKNNTPAVVVKKNGHEQRIRLNQIMYMEQQVHQLDIHLKNGAVEEVYESISALEPLLRENNFVIPHKSYAVNLSCVRSVDTELRCFIMQNGKNIPIRRESMGRARQILEDYLLQMTRQS